MLRPGPRPHNDTSIDRSVRHTGRIRDVVLTSRTTGYSVACVQVTRVFCSVEHIRHIHGGGEIDGPCYISNTYAILFYLVRNCLT